MFKCTETVIELRLWLRRDEMNLLCSVQYLDRGAGALAEELEQERGGGESEEAQEREEDGGREHRALVRQPDLRHVVLAHAHSHLA